MLLLLYILSPKANRYNGQGLPIRNMDCIGVYVVWYAAIKTFFGGRFYCEKVAWDNYIIIRLI